MVDEAGGPYVAGEQEVHLNWKTRLKTGSSSKSPDYGSFYTILPKGQVEELGWRPTQRLISRVHDGGIVLQPVDAEPIAERASPTLNAGYPSNNVACGDVLEELRLIPSDSVHMIITSPPYNLGIDYPGYDDKRAYSNYRRWLSHVWVECWRVLKRGGRFALEVAPTGIAEFVPLHHDLSRDIRAARFTHRAEILWTKFNMTARRTAWGSWMSPRHPHVIPSWEYIEVFHKESWKLDGDRERIDIWPEEFVEWSNGVWSITPDTYRWGRHPATFPEDLIRRLLLFFTYRGNTVLDPFGGTGTVAVVAKRNGRNFIHIDQSREYCDVTLQRLAQTKVVPQRPYRRSKSAPKGDESSPSIFVRERGIAPRGVAAGVRQSPTTASR